MYEWKGGPDVIGIPGVPARDLTDKEAELHGVTDCELYKKARLTAAEKATRDAGTREGNR